MIEQTALENKKANYMEKICGASYCKYVDLCKSQESCTGYIKNSFEDKCTFCGDFGKCDFTPEGYRNVIEYNKEGG